MLKLIDLKTKLIAVCLCLATLGFAQNPLWSFPQNYWQGPPHPLTSLPSGSASNQYPHLYNPNATYVWSYSNYASVNEDSVGPHNLYADASGKPLIYVANGFMYNANGYLIDSLTTVITSIGNMFGNGYYIPHSNANFGAYWYSDSAFKQPNSRQMAEGWAEVCIVPVPGNCKQYYVFTACDETNNYLSFLNCGYAGGMLAGNGYKPYFALVDASLPTPGAPYGQYGKNITNTLTYIPTGGSTPVALPGGGRIADLYASTNTPSSGRSCSPDFGDIQYACTKLIGGSYRFLFVTNGNEITVYKITSSGITCVNNYELSNLPGPPVNSWFGNNLLGFNLAELECYVDSTNNIIKVAIEGRSDNVHNLSGEALAFATFNMTTGSLNTSSFTNICVNCAASFDSTFIRGIEFSANGNYVYLINNYNGIAAYTWSTPGGVLYPTPTIISTGSSHVRDFVYSQLELAKDGNMYLIGQNGSSSPRLAKIAGTNTPSTAVFTDNVLTLPNYNIVHKTMYCPYSRSVPSDNPVFFLPDQIDQENYSNLFTVNNSCCIFYNSYDRQSYSAGANQPTGWTGTTQTWAVNTTSGTYQNNPLTTTTSNIITIGEELRIPAGYTVTINNLTLKFSPQARLIIENGSSSKSGGKLILSGCTLTVDNRCITDMWPGVQVWGSPTYSQLGTYQGFLQMSNNTVIENAYVGVLAGYDTTWLSNVTPRPSLYPANPLNDPYTLLPHIPTGGSPLLSGGGGIVQSINTSFINNQRAAAYYTYTFSASAGQYLQTSTFVVNSALLNTSVSPRYFIGLYGHTNNFAINGCTFNDTYNTNKDTGLFSTNSTAWIDKYLSTSRSVFSNLLYGIYATNAAISNTTLIHCVNTTFNNNYYGIYLGLIKNAVITTTDTFRIFANNCTGHCRQPQTYGLYLDNCTGYDVQDNNFTKYGSFTPTNSLYGIIVNNSGPYANAIFRNTFNHLYTGCQAQFVNYVAAGSTANGTGLLFQCNNFSSGTITNADIYVPGNSSGANDGTISCPTCALSGIQSYQGSGGNTAWPPNADNVFSHTGSGAYDFYIDSTSTPSAYSSTYHYLCTSGCGTSSLNPIIHKNIPPTAIATSTVSCSSTNPYSNGYRTSDPIVALLNQADGYKTVYDSLNNLIDGGSTTGLLALVTGNNNHQAVLNSLTQALPYLSDEVLIAYINSNYPADDITTILSACSPLTNAVNKAINTSALSDGIKSQMASLQNGSSTMHELGSLTGAVLASRHILMDKAIHTLLENQDSASTQQAYAIMRTRANELPHRVRLETALELGDHETATQELTAVNALEGNTNYVALHTILVNNMDKTPTQIMQDAAIRSQVMSMITDSSDRYVYLKANVLLQSVGLSKYVPYIQENNRNQNDNNERTTAIQTIVPVSLSTLYNQPNPFKENTTIQAHVAEKTQNAYLLITDMMGAELARYPVQQGDNSIAVNAANLSQSVMFCTLIVDGVKIRTNKMVLIK